MFAETKIVLAYLFLSIFIQFGRYNQFSQNVFQRRQIFYFLRILKKLLAAQLRELTKNIKNFLQGQNVSGNFVTKLHYYFQAWGSM